MSVDKIDTKPWYIKMLISNREILGVIDTAAQMSAINISLFQQVVPRPKLQGRITKSTKLQSLWKGPPYLISTVNPPMLYQIKDRKSESWIHHDRLELCEDRALIPIWLKHHRNELMNENVANGEFDLTKLFEEDDAAMSASDPLMYHIGIDQDNASASYFLMPQTDNGQGSASAPDLLVSRGAVDDKFNIFDSNIIEDLNKLHNDNTANLNVTFLYRVNDDSTEEAAPSLLHSRWQRRVRRRSA